MSDPTNTTPIVIERRSPWDAGVAELIEGLDAHLDALYPAEFNHKLNLAALDHPDIVLLVASVDGAGVGCGALRFMDDASGRYAEIKRMYVRPDFRRKGIAVSLLRRLEDHAREQRNIARLETGQRQIEAISLYERCGYRRREPFGAYPDNGNSLFYEKVLR